MWSNGELKSRAKDNLRIYYWSAFLVSLILAILTGGFSFGGSRISMNRSNGYRHEISGSYGLGSYKISRLGFGVILMVIMMTLVILLVAFCFKVFVGNVIEVGARRYFMESRAMRRSADIGRVGWGFGGGRYLNIVKIMFLRDLYTFLWGLLLVIPGIYKSYEYSMIPYILSENPEMDSNSVFALTKEMMDGNRFNKFILELSFIGWYLLGAIACGLGILFVNPYYDATEAELYGYFRDTHPHAGLQGYGVYEEGRWEWEDNRSE